MSTALQGGISLPPADASTLAQLEQAHNEILKFEQIPVHTEHILHGGMYSRTIRLQPETRMVGSLITKATLLIVSGSCSILAGYRRVELEGYNVLAGCPGRKQLFITHTAVEMTMIFATQAKTVEAAENEVFGEADMLMSRKDASGDTITITGY